MILNNLGNFQGIDFESDISVITLEDGLTHTYCSKIKWEKDNFSPIGIGKLIMPYDENISKYWSTYYGTVIIHANLMDTHKSTFDDSKDGISLNLKGMQEKINPTVDEEDKKNKVQSLPKTKKIKINTDVHNNKIRLQNDIYNYSFIGKVHRFKQVGKTFIVYLEDLGWKFMQKVPKEFRDAYISGQRLGDAFQSICEFIGVEFAYSIEDLNQFSFAADGYSVEKDGQIIEDVTTVLSEWAAPEEEEEETTEDQEGETDEEMAQNLNRQGYENPGLTAYDNQSNNQSPTQTPTQLPNQAKDGLNDQIVDEQTIQLQIQFDAKIKDLFKGNTMYNSNISDPVLNYDWVTAKSNPNSAQATTDPNAQANNQLPNQANNQTNNQATNQPTNQTTT